MEKLSDYLVADQISPESRVSGGTDIQSYLNPVNLKSGYTDRKSSDYTSFFDKNRLPIDSPFLDDLRARNQSRGDKWVNGIIRGVVTAGTTAVEPFVDLLVGAPSAMFSGDASKVYDNSLSRLLDTLNESAREAMPIYKDRQYEQAGFLEKVTKANFWAEDFTQGIGFMTGAVLSTYIGAGLLNAAKIPGAAKGAYSAVTNTMRGKNAGTSAAMLKDLTANVAGKVGAETFGKSVMSKAIGLLAAAGESGIEARGAKDAVRAELERRNSEMLEGETKFSEEEIDRISSQAGNVSFLVNMALVGGSNIIQFDNIVKGFLGVNAAAKGGTTMVGKGLLARAAAATGKTGKALAYGKAALMNPLTETFQEGGQFVTEKYLEDMMGRLYDPTAVNSVNDYMDGLGRALEKTFGSTEGQTSMFLGALLGAIGLPGMGGGIYGDVKEANKRFAAEQVAADAINKTHLGKKFAGLHRTATYSANYARRQEEALASGDPFAVIDVEMDNFKTYLLELAAAGRLDIAEQHLEGILDLVEAVKDGSDPNALAQYMEATGFTEKNAVESIASMQEFAEFFKKGIKRAEAAQAKIAPFAEVHPELGRLVGDLLMSEGNYDQLIEKAQKTMNDIASTNKMSFNFEEIFKSENPSQELNGLVLKYINTYKIDPIERKALQAAKTMLLGAEGQKALIKQAYDYISSEEKNGYAELIESMTAKRAMFDRMSKNKGTKTTLVEGMEWENEDDKAIFDQNTMVEDGEFISGEFEVDIPVSKPRKGPPTEFNELMTPEQIQAEIDDWYKTRGLDRAEEEAKGAEEIGIEKATGTFLPNGDIRVVSSTGKVSILKRGPINYARIDQSTIKSPQEIKAKTETAKIRGIVVQLGEVVKAKLADNATTAATLKEKIAEIEEAVKAAQVKVFDRGTTAKMIKDFKKATKALEASAQEISEQLAVLSEQREILEKERLLLLEEYKYLQQDGMTVAEYTKRRDSMVESQTEIEQHIEDKSNLLTYLTSLIEKLKAFIARLTKPLGTREGSVVSDVAVVVKDLTADEFELAEDAGTLLSSYAIQRDINNITNDLAQLKQRAEVLDQTVPILNSIIKKYNQRVAAERRAAKKAAMQKKAGLEANPEAPTTEIPDQQVIYKDGTEAPKGTIHEVFKSTTGNHPQRTALGNAWFKFTETLTLTEMEEFKLVPVIAEANQFQELFSEFGVEFVDTTEGKDIKLVVVDAQGTPVMRFGLPLVTSMALPKATWASGEQRFVATDPTIAKEVMAAYAKERMVIVEQLIAGKTDYRFDLTGKRRGVPILDPNFIDAARPDNLADMAENPHKSVVGVLAESEEAAEKLTVGVAVDVVAGTRGRTTAQSGTTATMRAGAVYVDTGAAVVPLIKRRITQQEARSILNIMKMMVTQRAEYLAAVKAKSPNASKLKETYAYFPGTKIKIKEHLENLLAWGNLNKEFPEYNIYFSRSETSAGELHVGSSVYEVSELLEENSVAGQAVVDFLVRKFHHVNAKTLKNRRKYTQVTVADDFTVTTKEYPSYKSYLISPNGREQKDVPLGTWLIDQSPEDPTVNQYMSVNLTYDTRIASPMPSATPGTQTANSEDVEDLLAKIEAAELARAGKAAPQEFGETAGFTGEVNEDEMNAVIEAAARAEEARQRQDEQENQKPAAVSEAAVEEMWAAFENAELARTNAKAVDKAAPSAKPVAPVRVVEEQSFEEDADDLGIDYEDGVDRQDDSAPRVLATELTEELNWFQNAFSRAEKIVIANMSNAGVLGRVTRAGQVLINNITAPGTIYHEAFHLVSNFYMPNKQQRALWNEWRERTGKKNATDLEAEEGLAEDFRMYAESGGAVMPKYQDRSWFKKLYDFLKNFITRSKSIETIFQDIYEGKYATQGRQARTLSVALNRMSAKDLRDQMDIKDSNSSQLLELMDAFTMQVMAEVHAMSKIMNIPPLDIISGKPIIDPATGQPARNEKGNVRRYSNQIYLLAMNQLVKQYNALKAMPTRDDKLNAQMTVIESVLRNKTAFLQFHVDYMRDSQLNVKFQRNTKTTVLNNETGDTIQDMIDEQEIGGRLTWDWIDSVQIDPTSQTTPELKVLFTGIRKTFAGNKLSGATLGLPKMAPVKDLISYLQVELAGIRTFPDMVEKVRSLTSARPELQVILDRMKIPASGPITPINLSEGHKKMQDAFFRQFAKAPYNFQLLLKNREGELVMFNSNRQRNEDRILNAWEAALPSSLSSRVDFVEIKAGRRQFNPDYKFKFGPGREFSLKNMQKNEVAKTLSFADRLQVLAAFGITFERPDGISAKVVQAAFPSIVNYVVANPSLNTFFKNNRKGKLSISQDLRKLALEALKVSSSRIDLMHQTADGKNIYGVGDYNYLLNLFTQLRDLPDDVLPDQWNPELNITAKGSHWLSSPNRNELEVQLLSGFKNDQSKEGNETSKLDTATLMATYFHAFNAGIMPIPRTAEKNLVYGVRIPEDLKVNSLNQAVEILQNHLRTELETMMALDLEGTGSDIQYYKDRAKGLRMFAGITVNPSNLMSQEDVEFFVDQAKPDLEAYLLRERQTVEELLEAYGLFTRMPNSTSVQTVLKPTAKTSSRGAMVMSKEDFDTMVSEFTYNSLIANMEATKLLYGDLAFFKTNEEFFKRTPGAVGTKLLPRLDEDNLLWLNENRMRMDERERDGTMRLVTFDDVKVGTTVAELENIHPGKYGEMDEADAQGWTSVDGYRDFHLFNNSWSPEQEAAFEKIKVGTPLSQKEIGLFGPFKPMYFGPQAGVNIMAPTYLKTSLMPLIPDFFRHQPTASNLKALYDQMVEKQLDIVIMDSGNKLGRKMPVDENGQATNLPFYNQTGQINTIPDSAISTLQWEYLGEQVKVDPGVDTEVNFGTQPRKLIWSMMFEGGVAKPITVSTAKSSTSVKQGVEELFDSNPELANQVYEALGFEIQIPTKVSLINKFAHIYNIIYQGKRIGNFELPLNLEGDSVLIGDVEIEEEYRGKGLGVEVYKAAINLSPKPIVSLLASLESNRVWESLVRQGLAIKTEDGYKTIKPSITPQQKQQALQVYSQYLDTIFPDSKVKDIVYHKSREEFEEFDFNRLGQEDGVSDGVFFSDKQLTFLQGFPFEIKALVNISDLSDISVMSKGRNINQIVAKTPEQIHILGGKQDIEGLKEFVKASPAKPSTRTLSSAEVQGLYDEYTGIINEMLEESEQALMTEMGLSLNAEGDYVFSKDPEQVVKMIEVEMRRMDYPENSIDGMRMMFASEVKKVDVLPNKREVEQLLMSLAKNRVMRQQMPGSMRVLVANTGFESKRETDVEILRSNDLGFYEESKDGVTKRAEIKIPLPKEWIKAIYSMTGTSKSQDLGVALRAFNQMIAEGKVDENILYRTAYRIPNHGLPATDAFIVKEFLHPAAGNIVVPPSEIVVKAGSDYDIDKLTVFDRNVEITDEGIKYVTEGRKGKENRLMEIMESIILAPENYKDLTQPTDARELKDLAKVVRKAKKYEGLPKSGLGMLGFKNIVRVARSFWSGKDGVGITAVNLTSHTIAQASRLRYISPTPLIFATAPENELLATQDNATAIDLSRAYDSKGNSIMKTLGMFLNAYVDVAKDDFIMDINAGPAFSGVYMFLIRAGVPLDTIVYFMNQPAVNQVLLRLDTQQAEIFEGSKGLDGKPLNKSRSEIFSNVRDMFKTSMKSDQPLTDAELIAAMNNDIASVQKFNAIQLQVLNALEAYIEAAQDLRSLIQASNFDTTFGKTWRSPQLRESKLSSLAQKEVFENMEAYVDSPLLQGFRAKSRNSGNYFKSLFISASPGVAKFVAPILDIITENSSVFGVTPFATERALKALEDDLTTFLLETVKANNKVLIDKAKQLLFGPTSLPLRIEQAKKMPALEGNYLLDKLTALVAPIREGRLLSPDSMQLFSNKLNSQETAALVDGFVELAAVNSSLAQDVADFLVIQTGVGFSPKSGIRIIPAGMYIDRAIEVLKTVEGQNVDNLMKEFKIQFFQNNTHLNGVAPTLKKNYDDQTSFKHTFYGNSTAPEYVANTFSFLEDLGETDEQGQPKKTKKYHRALYHRAGIEQRTKEMNNKIVGITEATYTRVGEKGVVNSFKEYYPTSRLSMLPVNNLKFTSVKVADPKLTNPMGKLPAALKVEKAVIVGTALPSSSAVKFEESKSESYAARTAVNASADATIAIAANFNSAGEKLTKSSVLGQNKLYLPVSTDVFASGSDVNMTAGIIAKQLNNLPKNEISLNIAGNSIYTLGGIMTQAAVDNFTLELLQKVIERLNPEKKIVSLRTGGQTGFDEGGAKAGIKLGIPTTILAPKGWKFRNISGTDVSSEKLFKARFELPSTQSAEKIDAKPAFTKTDAMITRRQVQSNKDVLFAFGDNNIRKGLGGQAKEMRGEPNAFGISTKKLPASTPDAYMTDSELEANKQVITSDVNKLIAAWNTGNYTRVIVPQIGVGLAGLPTRAPKTYAHLTAELDRLKSIVEAAQSAEVDMGATSTELIRALSAELTPDQYNYLLENYSVAGLVGAINKSSGTFEEMISDAVEHWRTLAEKNC